MFVNRSWFTFIVPLVPKFSVKSGILNYNEQKIVIFSVEFVVLMCMTPWMDLEAKWNTSTVLHVVHDVLSSVMDPKTLKRGGGYWHTKQP